MKKKHVILGASVLLIGTALYYFTTVSQATREVSAGPDVLTRTVFVKKGEISQTSFADGSVMARVESEVRSELTGRLQETLVSPGDEVKAGQRLFILDARDLEIKVAEAQTSLAVAQTRFEKIQDDLALRERQLEAKINQAEANLISANAKLAGLRSGPEPEEVEQFRSQLRQAETNLQAQKDEVGRLERLLAQDAVSKQQVVEAKLKLATLDEQHISANEKLNLLLKGPNTEDIAASEAVVRQVQSDLESLMLEKELSQTANEREIYLARQDVQKAELGLRTAKLNYEKAEITAPVGGVVTAVNAASGNLVSTNSTLARVVQMQPIDVQVLLDEIDFSQVAVGQEAIVRVDAYQDREYRGRVYYVSQEGVNQNGVTAFPVYIEVENGDLSLKPGMTAEAEIVVVKKESALLVPAEAIQNTGNQKVVELMVDGEKTKKAIRTGITSGGMTEVLDGLKERDRVVITMQAKVNPYTGAAAGQTSSGGGMGSLVPNIFGGSR